MLIEADYQGEIQGENQIDLISMPSENINQTVYSKYFGFLQSPFTSLPKKCFFFEHVSASEVINTVVFSLNSGESIVKVTGDAGVGKTFLIRQVLSSLGDDYFAINMITPNLSPNIFLKSLIEELGATCPLDANDAQLIKYIQYLLYDHYSKSDYKIVVWVDDAHTLSADTLEIILALSKLETSHRSLLQFVISGSKKLDDTLSLDAMRSFKDRITFSSVLRGLKYSEVQAYVESHLRIVGADNPECFSRSAMQTLFKKTSGIPARINKLSHKALMLAFGKGDARVEKSHVIKAAYEDTQPHTINMLFIAPLAVVLITGVIALYFNWLSL